MVRAAAKLMPQYQYFGFQLSPRLEAVAQHEGKGGQLRSSIAIMF
jgi:hypothetical protein